MLAFVLFLWFSLTFPDCILHTEGVEESIQLFPFFTESLRVVAVGLETFPLLGKRDQP